MGETKVRHETPEWAKPEIRSTPTPAPVVARSGSQGGRRRDSRRPGRGRHAVRWWRRPASATMTRPAPMPVAPPPAPGRKSAAINSRPGAWADPFAEAGARKEPQRKQVAAARTRQVSDDLDEDVRPSRKAAPAPSKREASRGGDWSDPFQDTERKAPKRGAAPAGKSSGGKSADPASWKDPFTSSEPAKPSRPWRARAPSPRTGRWRCAPRSRAPRRWRPRATRRLPPWRRPTTPPGRRAAGAS